MQLLLFSVDSTRCAVRATDVVEVVRAVAITPLPGAPSVIEGLIDLRGAIVPVFDLRLRLDRSSRPVALTDHFVIVRAPGRHAALHVDAVSDLIEIDGSAIADPRAHASTNEIIGGVAALPDGLVLITDVARFLSAAERDSLDAALARFSSLPNGGHRVEPAAR